MTIAVTGATGDVGIPVLAGLERSPRVSEIRAMARGPFSPSLFGFRKVRFRRGDVRSREAVRELVGGAEVVVHLAFDLRGSRRSAAATNLDGSRILFEETVRCGASRLVCASSIGGYGSEGGSAPCDESADFMGTAGHSYSEQKAEMERLMARTLAGSGVSAYALRLAIVAGPLAQLMLREIPYVRLRSLLRSPPGRPRGRLRPVLPDTGVPLQLLHEEDLGTAFAAAALSASEPGAYNLAADGTVTVSDLARALGWRSIRVPRKLIDRAAVAARKLPAAPPWLEVARAPVLVATDRARSGLGWSPRYDAQETLGSLVDSYRRNGPSR